MHKIVILVTAVLFCAVDAGAAQTKETGMKLTCPEFMNNSNMPSKFTCEGRDVNPELLIEDVPEGTKSLALIVDDPDAPAKTWVHWVVYDMAATGRIAEDSVPGRQGTNDSGGRDWSGPCPPSGTHRYYFKLYALDKMLGLGEGIDKKALEKAMGGHILDKAELIGLYKRGKK